MSQAALPSAILDSLKTPVLVADTDHTIIYMNRAAVARYERGLALIGTSMLDCHNEQSNRVIRQTLKELEAGAEERFIYTGDLGRVYMRAVRGADGQLLGYYERYELTPE